MKPSKQTTVSTLWHPNFRIVRDLPDTKVIRTSFAINAAAVAVVVILAGVLYQRETATAAIQAQVMEWTATIESNTPRYQKALQLQKEFSASEKKVREIEAFVSPRFVSSDFLKIISETLPKLIALDSIEMYGTGVRLRGMVVGASEQSAPLAKEYAAKLAALPAFAEQMESVRLNSQSRDQIGNRFQFEIELKLKPRK